ncbi:hypothetical protein QAD02_004124 [Eretmocerus hayati]|uniref:Uncharacterized protein n=1 Tax=Eretmocerus hayati TaxID=131215 RepID=A0ACC2NNM6_9HYME|nr:hypothetical protein QAD02_004124 [Eretmocerus hayati]
MEANQKKYLELKQALHRGNKTVIKSLLKEGAPVNGRPEGCELRTALHYSVYLGCLEIVKELLERGASVNVRNLNNETPLMLAAKFEKKSLNRSSVICKRIGKL